MPTDPERTRLLQACDTAYEDWRVSGRRIRLWQAYIAACTALDDYERAHPTTTEQTECNPTG